MAPTTHDSAAERHWTCARRLRERRHALGLTQAEVVARIAAVGLTNRSVSGWENGRGLDIGWLPDLAEALDCSVTYLLGQTDDPRRWQPDRGPRARERSPDRPPPVDSDIASAPPVQASPDPVHAMRTLAHRNWILGPDAAASGPDPTADSERSIHRP